MPGNFLNLKENVGICPKPKELILEFMYDIYLSKKASMFSMKFSNCVLVCRVLVHFIKCVIFFSFSSMETLKLKETISRLKIPQQTNSNKCILTKITTL